MIYDAAVLRAQCTGLKDSAMNSKDCALNLEDSAYYDDCPQDQRIPLFDI